MTANPDYDNAVAIIGMAGRFPAAADVDALWQRLRAGQHAVEPLSDDALLEAGVDARLLADPHYVKSGTVLADIDCFDAAFFGITPREAQLMDPQHRLFLECAWHALEHAGYDPQRYEGAIGLYAGTATSTYLFENLLSNPEALAAFDLRQVQMVNDKDFLTGRVAYELDLRGPAVAVQTACSTSLVAVHMACQSVLAGECDMAMAGGVSIQTLKQRGYLYTEGGLLSRDGYCHAFDVDATGTIFGNGLGIVVLKPLADALADGDTVHAIIRGSAINNDGHDKASFAAPSVDGQAAVIREAQAVAGVAPSTIGYIEAHGTGTQLGDPIEMSALKQAFGDVRGKRQFCGIGSLKSNVGHLDTAAGVSGLIKAALAVRHGEIPPSLHVSQPNPHIGFADSPFYVNTELRAWPPSSAPRRAGVSSFGIGGTNAHIIVEESQQPASSSTTHPAEVLQLSAKSPAALDRITARLAEHLAAHPATNLADTAFTLEQGRTQFGWRRAVACRNVADAIAALQAPPAARQTIGNQPAPVVFMFPGGGTQYVGMARELYQAQSVFRAVIDECAGILVPILGCDLRDLLFAPTEHEATAAATLDQTHFALAALFSVEYGLAKQFAAWGVEPAAMVGHSLGEYVAACLAGVFSLADALKVVTERGRLIASQPTGSMLAVLATPEQMSTRLGPDLWLACVNGRNACTISGTPTATEALAVRLEAEGFDFQLLRGWPGSHSGLMEPILAPFRAVLETVTLRKPSRPYLSNLTGDWITPEQATDREYWVSHLHQAVQFAGCLATLRRNPDHVYVEIGPGHTLVNLAKRDADEGRIPNTVSCLPRRDAVGDSLLSVLNAAGQLWALGVAIDWPALRETQARRRVPLPGYAFERTRYWIEAKAGAHAAHAAHGSNESGQDGQAGYEPAQVEASLTYQGRPSLPTAYTAPASATEKALAGLWEQLLGVSPVGVDDSFFLLGGSSLSAIQLTSRIRGTFQVELPLRALFETPTIAAQAKEIERRRADGADTNLAISKRADQGDAPLSSSQQRLWIVEQLDPTAGRAYYISKPLRLKGRLDVAALRTALNQVVARHEALRTSFAEHEGTTVQRIAPADTGFALVERDLSHVSGEEQAFLVRAIATDEATLAFDLGRGPLVRGQLLRLGDEEHVLLVTHHHIITDGWSIGVLVQEFATLYNAHRQGKVDPLPPLPLQYADYATWQQRWLEGDTPAREAAFWKAYLAGAPECIELPTDFPRPAEQRYEGESVALSLAPEVCAGLKALGQRHGATLFMTLLAGWAVALSRLSGQHDLVVGTPVANRQRAELEPLIGYFVNTLALRVQSSGNPTVAELLGGVRSSVLAAFEHQDYPFDRVVEALQPARSTSHSPLFQVMINLHNTPGNKELMLDCLLLEPQEEPVTTVQVDLMLSLADVGERVVGEITYASSLFERDSVERLANLLQQVFTRMAADDSQCLSDLVALSDAERRQLLVDFNDSARPFPAETPIHVLFEAQASERPDAIALAFDDQGLSYAELNRRANRLAHRLMGMGVRPDQLVAIGLPRGIDFVVGLLGVLKAGAAYLPLDLNHPADRLAYILQDSQPVALLTHAALADAFVAQALPLLLIDADAALATQATDNPDHRAIGLDTSHLAYVIYTSGSTGRPKGVQVPHLGLCNMALAQIDAFGVGPDSRVLQFAAPGFDASVSEVAMALCSGAQLCLATREALWPGEPLAQTLLQHAVTHVTLPPSVLAAFENPERFAAMTVIVAGEACPPSLAQRWTSHHTLFNAYGPTEATVCASLRRCDGQEGANVPIGRPLANVQLYLLEPQGQPVPVGVCGEIHIGGVGIARGYLGLSDLSAERFVADPFRPGGRLYRTGDLGRWLPNGEVEFLGRNDFQVKIRGLRIELGEIEARLLACPGVRESLVLGRADTTGERRLVAYLTASAGAELSAAELRDAIARQLPDYMVPAAFVVLDAFPLTANGKVDRNALPDAGASAVIRQAYEAPAGQVEEELARTWQEILQLDQVGRHDHFFELGGHSLMVARLLARIRERHGVSLPLSRVYQTPTVAALAALIVEAELERYADDDVARAMRELEDLSPEEIERLLAEEMKLTNS